MQKVCLLFGGKSPEHDVSVLSAKNVYMAIDKNLFNVSLVYIHKEGSFYKVNTFEDAENVRKNNTHTTEAFDIREFKNFDTVLPVMHGPNCEDGSLQGFLEILGVKYIGCKVLSSALCMDKDIQKQIARHNGIPVTDWIAVKNFEYTHDKRGKLEEINKSLQTSLQYPVFVKPSRMGSSVGVVKVKSEKELEDAIEIAFTYDTKIIIEKAVQGREIEIAVLGSKNDVLVSNPGEIVVLGSYEFYDYQSKYTDNKGSKTHIPAPNVPEQYIQDFKELSKRIYTLFECEGLSRIDFFFTEKSEIILNEINTFPGFTHISMYPKLMEQIGVGYTELITRVLRD